MKSPFYFIVKPLNDKRYDNVKKVGNVNLITSTSKEDHKSSNRFAEVVSVPNGYKGNIKVGDTLLVHHNVFKFYNDMKGTERSGRSFLKDNLFFVDPDQYYMYKNASGWHTVSKYCFIKPSEKKDSYIFKPGGEEPLTGIIKYINKDLKSLGLSVGDEVVFNPGSEYEFIIEGERLYRMFTNNIAIKL